MSQVSALLQAIRSGFLLAGLLTCSCGRSLVGETTIDGGSDVVAEDDAGSDAGPVVPVLPADRELTCTGPTFPETGTSGYHGSCCEHVVCRAAPAGGCPKGDDGRSYGSGTCLCGTGEQIDGPYTIGADDPRFADERQKGPCCYITTSISCDGRPLHVAQDVRVAPVVVRRDWC